MDNFCLKSAIDVETRSRPKKIEYFSILSTPVMHCLSDRALLLAAAMFCFKIYVTISLTVIYSHYSYVCICLKSARIQFLKL